MPDVNEIRPPLRIHPTAHEQRGGTKKKPVKREEDKGKDRQKSSDNKGKVDEYI